MAYVFGIEGVPVFEMLFIMMGLLLLGLILSFIGLLFVLMELRKLTKLISQETLDLMRFERDLQTFEKGQGTTMDGVVERVRKALASGISRPKIEFSLYRSGWSKEDVEALFEKVHAGPGDKEAPGKQEDKQTTDVQPSVKTR
jgi:hypothetical protein